MEAKHNLTKLQLIILQWIQSAERRSHEERINPQVYSEEIGKLAAGGWIRIAGTLSGAHVDLTEKGRNVLENIRIDEFRFWNNCTRAIIR